MNELVTSLHENLSDPFLVEKLRGTPFIAWFFRLLGAKIGKRAYIDTTCFTEYDLVHIGDDVALGTPDTAADASVRRPRHENVRDPHRQRAVGRRPIAGPVRHDDGTGSSLGDLSLLMKNEQLPAGTSWEGIPARPVD